MAIVNASELWRFLKALGCPEHCIEFRLTARVDDIVTAEAVYYPSLDLTENGERMTATKRFILAERPPEEDAER